MIDLRSELAKARKELASFKMDAEPFDVSLGFVSTTRDVDGRVIPAPVAVNSARLMATGTVLPKLED